MNIKQIILSMILVFNTIQIFGATTAPVQVIIKDNKLYNFDDLNQEIQLQDHQELLQIKLPNSIDYFIISSEQVKNTLSEDEIVTSSFKYGKPHKLPITQNLDWSLMLPTYFIKPKQEKEQERERKRSINKTIGFVSGIAALGLIGLTYSDFIKTLPQNKKLGYITFIKKYLQFLGKKIKTDKKCTAIVTITLLVDAYALYLRNLK